MVLANYTSGLSDGPLLCYFFLFGAEILVFRIAVERCQLYVVLDNKCVSMLGLSLCQCIGVKMPHKLSGLVTKETVGSFLGIIPFISFLRPGLLPLGVCSIIAEKLQLHVMFQLSTFILCALYAALGVEYL